MFREDGLMIYCNHAIIFESGKKFDEQVNLLFAATLCYVLRRMSLNIEGKIVECEKIEIVDMLRIFGDS